MLGRMRQETRRLADDNERHLLMYEHGLGCRTWFSIPVCYREIRSFDDIPGFQPVMNVDQFAIDRDLIRLEKFLYLISRNIRMLRVQEYVEPLSFSSFVVIVHVVSV